MSGQIKLKLPSGGSKTIAAPDSAATETITLPAGTKTLATVENFTSTGIDDNATSTKLTTTSTGIDVTGTVIADGLTVDTNTLYVDSANNRVGIGTSSPAAKLHVNSNVLASSANDADVRDYRIEFSGRQQTGGIDFNLSSPTAFLDFYAGGSPTNLGAWSGGMRFHTGGTNQTGTERMRIDSNGLGIGTSSPQTDLVVSNGGNVGMEWSTTDYTNNMRQLAYNRGTDAYVALRTEASQHEFYIGGTERMRIDSSGNLKFDSGYGSAATAYGCRAWVNFRGTGTVAIRASGNASSITDNGAGDYTLNFSTTFPDNSFACVGITNTNTGDANRPVVICNTNQTPSSVTIESVGTHNNNTNIDCGVISISVFR